MNNGQKILIFWPNELARTKDLKSFVKKSQSQKNINFSPSGQIIQVSSYDLLRLLLYSVLSLYLFMISLNYKKKLEIII